MNGLKQLGSFFQSLPPQKTQIFLDISLLNYIFLCPPQDVRKATELETAMEKQKLKIDMNLESDIV